MFFQTSTRPNYMHFYKLRLQSSFPDTVFTHVQVKVQQEVIHNPASAEQRRYLASEKNTVQ